MESQKVGKLESLESHQKAKSRGEKERKKAVVLSTVLYYEWMPIRIVIFIYNMISYEKGNENKDRKRKLKRKRRKIERREE